eukprot:7679393-Alexandrium_andersonii.AAC.1
MGARWVCEACSATTGGEAEARNRRARQACAGGQPWRVALVEDQLDHSLWEFPCGPPSAWACSRCGGWG